jgi:calpain-15
VLGENYRTVSSFCMSFERWGEKLTEVTENTFSETVAECVATGNLFVDPAFPPEDSSLFFDPEVGRKTWKCHDCNKSCPIPENVDLGPSRDDMRSFFSYIAQTNPMLAMQMQANPGMATQLIQASFPGANKPQTLTCTHCGGTNPLRLLELVPTQWLRASEVRDDVTLEYGSGAPWKLIRGSVEADDVRQGAVGNCWFVGALSILAQQKPKLIQALFPFDQEYSEFGVYIVRLCKDGLWRNVLVDDYLPCTRNGTLCYTGAARRQVWVPLIEKAAAKLASCYEGLHAGTLCEAFSLLTGSPTERVLLFSKTDGGLGPEESDTLWIRVVSSHEAGYLVGLACAPRPDRTAAELHALGLQAPHAYTVSDTAEVTIEGELRRLVKLRNPWGSRSPSTWNGSWGISSSEKRRFDKQVNFTECHNGLFWMRWEDLVQNFASLEFCRVSEEPTVNARGWLSAITGFGDIFEIATGDVAGRFDISLYQESHAVRGEQMSRLVDLGCVLLAEKGLLAAHREERKFEPEISFETFLAPNKRYLIVPVSFANSFKAEHRKVVLSVRGVGMVTVTKRENTYSMTRSAVLAYCGNSEENETVAGISYAVTKDPSGTIITVRNRTMRYYAEVTTDTSESSNLTSSRTDTTTGAITFDSIPPATESVVQILTAVPGSNTYSISLSLATVRRSSEATEPHVPAISVGDQEAVSSLIGVHLPIPIRSNLQLKLMELLPRAKNNQDQSILMHDLMRQQAVASRLMTEYVKAGIDSQEAAQISEEEAEIHPL